MPGWIGTSTMILLRVFLSITSRSNLEPLKANHRITTDNLALGQGDRVILIGDVTDPDLQAS